MIKAETTVIVLRRTAVFVTRIKHVLVIRFAPASGNCRAPLKRIKAKG
jgi:hypothetical protein